jgi:hypothetical protein
VRRKSGEGGRGEKEGGHLNSMRCFAVCARLCVSQGGGGVRGSQFVHKTHPNTCASTCRHVTQAGLHYGSAGQ